MTKSRALGYFLLLAFLAFIFPFATLFIQGTYDRSWPLVCCTLPFGLMALIFLIVFFVKQAQEQTQQQAVGASQPVPSVSSLAQPREQELQLPPPQSSSGGGVLFVPLPLDEQNRPGER